MLICASLTTADPGDIFSTISSMAQEQIRISVVSLSAEVRVCRLMADKTGGAYLCSECSTTSALCSAVVATDHECYFCLCC